MNSTEHRHVTLWLCASWLGIIALGGPVAGAAEEAPVSYLRVSEANGKSISLEIASRDYLHADGFGPRVALVGVAHIGDRAFYDAVAKLLSEYEVVLFESVKPEGTGGAGGENDEQRINSTKAAMNFVGSTIETYRHAEQQYPPDVEALRRFAAQRDPRMIRFLDAAMVDAWGRPFQYTFMAGQASETSTDGEPVAASYILLSLGADGLPGGEHANSDISSLQLPKPTAMEASQDDGLQGQLADALGLEFQLDALPYELSNWRCSDMAMDELNRRFEAKGLDFSVMGGTLAGSSLPAMAIKFLLGLLKMADSMTEGAITDTFKIVMIEMLGNPMILDQGLAQLGQGFSEIIVDERNQIVIQDLKKLIDTEPQVKSVALLYGAAHMPDMAARMAEQLHYHSESEDKTRWLTAISVDLTKSKVPASQLQQIRSMMKQTLQRQFRGK